MDTHHPLCADRLYALLGEDMYDLPPCFIERLEQTLAAAERERVNTVVRLHPTKCRAATAPMPSAPHDGHGHAGKIALPVQTLQGLDCLLELLQSVQVARQDRDTEGLVSEHVLEGLIVAGRQLLKGTAGTVRGDA